MALERIFEDCIRFCLRFLEVVPWTQDDEARMLNLIPHLSEDESKDLITRVSRTLDSSEEMLYGLILALTHNPSMVFVAKLLLEFGSKDLVERVLDRVFQTTFKVVKEFMEEYTSLGVRGDHDETKAI
ncbi:BTB/POZ domain-containing protein [Pyrus ussuriensis x Pyrus communis]|uniref:BTB/POZ domain-containing protein n=1 Tax=Pyrus ussuriensis x Pyrus communis TaxID=2448454 RepID=A0A5N5FTX0_9ROSA|nr:BTB/POZ domain-containing protein [Pyrus ussuriensis x Pyrus communis]